jgi:Fur family ferric uptake transcriptional regulator
LQLRTIIKKECEMQQADDHLRSLFRSAGLRLTSQRRLVLDVLQDSDKHLDAEALYERVKVRDADVSLATVYRTLAVLRDLGLVEEHHLSPERSYYEAVQDGPHYHFTCKNCGKVIEFDTPLVTQVSQMLREREGVDVISAHLLLSGYCAQCQLTVGGQDEDEE